MTHATERDGDKDLWLTCEHCGWQGLVYYKTRPPTYCSDACRAAAYRARKRDKLQAAGRHVSRKRREFNRVRTSYLEGQIAYYRARRNYDAAQALYRLARDVAAPIDEQIIQEKAQEIAARLG